MTESKVYLGDGVYIEPDHDIPGQFRLFTHNGISDLEEIFLDEITCLALVRYIQDKVM